MRAIRLGRNHRQAGIGLLANVDVQRDFAKEWHAKALGLMTRPAVAEDIAAGATLRAQEIAHVLDNAEYWHVDPLEHRDGAARIDQCKVLRRRNDDGAA